VNIATVASAPNVDTFITVYFGIKYVVSTSTIGVIFMPIFLAIDPNALKIKIEDTWTHKHTHSRKHGDP
jgi:hypothetical protein